MNDVVLQKEVDPYGPMSIRIHLREGTRIGCVIEQTD